MRHILSLTVWVALIFADVARAEDAETPILDVRVEEIKNRGGEIGIAVFKSPTGYPVHTE